ncbi:hypothetical protein WA026_009539 [Henosepilachna vigintioctopunctata]|uniref:Uncharacterized protein n=1 Tax=Henosepilachna vigintioctopunctata TaxID=420089 RepID=A0AAW1TVY9_9CUCU
MMKLLLVAIFACLATLSYASIHGALVGPSGVVTSSGAIGPVGNSLAWNHGGWGHGVWGAGPWGGWGHGGVVIAGPGAWGAHGHLWR